LVHLTEAKLPLLTIISRTRALIKWRVQDAIERLLFLRAGADKFGISYRIQLVASNSQLLEGRSFTLKINPKDRRNFSAPEASYFPMLMQTLGELEALVQLSFELAQSASSRFFHDTMEALGRDLRS
jgi:hypothetical protein